MTYHYALASSAQTLFVPVVCILMLLSGIAHLAFPGETDRQMSRPVNVRLAGFVLIGLAVAGAIWRFYIVAVLLVAFGLPRLLVPRGSIRLQQELYPRRVHGALLLVSAAILWIASG